MTARDEFEMSLHDETTAALRIPPHNDQAEANVLGGLLLDSGIAWDRVGDVLKESDFYRLEHRLVFAAVASLCNANKPADVTTVLEQLERQGKADDVGGIAYLGRLANEVPNASNIRRYAEIVRERAVLRGLIACSDELASMAFNLDGKTVDEVLDAAQAKVFAIAEGRGAARDDWFSMEDLVVKELDLINDRAEGQQDRSADFIPTGLADLDDMLDGGTRPGQLIIVGARPSMGKTALADGIAVHAATLGHQVAKFSMEMPNQEGAQRAISFSARIPMHMIRRPERMSPEHWSRLPKGVEDLRRLPFYSNDASGLNINQVRAKARAIRRRSGLKLLVVDYLQLMSGIDPRAPRTYQLEEASRGLKSLAKELCIPVIALVQVNRGVEKEADPMPRMSDIKDCGSIEQDADVILFLDRPMQRRPDLGQEWKYYARGRIAKQRGGRTGDLHFTFVGENTQFLDWPADREIPTSAVRTSTRGGDL